MRSHAAVIAVIMSVTVAFAADSKAPASGSAKFPDLKASNLESREFNLPRDFDGQHNLCLLYTSPSPRD